MNQRYTSFRCATLTTSTLRTLSSIQYTMRYSPTRTRQLSVPTSFLQLGGRGLSARAVKALMTLFWAGLGRRSISFCADGWIKTEYLAIFCKFLYELLKWHSFSALFLASLNGSDVLKVFQVFNKIIRQKLIKKIRRGDVVISSLQAQGLMYRLINVKCGFASGSHGNPLSLLKQYSRNTAKRQFGI